MGIEQLIDGVAVLALRLEKTLIEHAKQITGLINEGADLHGWKEEVVRQLEVLTWQGAQASGRELKLEARVAKLEGFRERDASAIDKLWGRTNEHTSSIDAFNHRLRAMESSGIGEGLADLTWRIQHEGTHPGKVWYGTGIPDLMRGPRPLDPTGCHDEPA